MAYGGASRDRIIGNCAYSAARRDGWVEWMRGPVRTRASCSDPPRSRAGRRVHDRGPRTPEVPQEYLENTNVLRTVFPGRAACSRSTDFAPRFRSTTGFKPPMLIRVMRPLSGEPPGGRPLPPAYDYGLRADDVVAGIEPHPVPRVPGAGPADDERAAHVRQDERPFLVERDRHLVLTWGQPLETGSRRRPSASSSGRSTTGRWVKGTRVPRDYQAEVIRSALVLKLHQYEDTGALLAATTTSIPEHPARAAPGTTATAGCATRTHAERARAARAPEEMERFLEYLRNLAEARGRPPARVPHQR